MYLHKSFEVPMVQPPHLIFVSISRSNDFLFKLENDCLILKRLHGISSTTGLIYWEFVWRCSSVNECATWRTINRRLNKCCRTNHAVSDFSNNTEFFCEVTLPRSYHKRRYTSGKIVKNLGSDGCLVCFPFLSLHITLAKWSVPEVDWLNSYIRFSLR
jgi:hypothetical protein